MGNAASAWLRVLGTAGCPPCRRAGTAVRAKGTSRFALAPTIYRRLRRRASVTTSNSRQQWRSPTSRPPIEPASGRGGQGVRARRHGSCTETRASTSHNGNLRSPDRDKLTGINAAVAAIPRPVVTSSTRQDPGSGNPYRCPASWVAAAAPRQQRRRDAAGGLRHSFSPSSSQGIRRQFAEAVLVRA
jgi:hypothetical protein